MSPKSMTVLEFDKVRRRLAERCGSPGGRALALALVPSTDLEEVRARQRITTEARDFQDRRGGVAFSEVHDLAPLVEAASRGKLLGPHELIWVRQTVAVGRKIQKQLERDETRYPGLAELAQALEPCPALYDAVQDALDDEGEVRDGASPALRRIRGELRVARDRLVRQLESIMHQTGVRDSLQEGLITQRNGRFVLPVKSDFRGRLPGVVHDTSDSGATVFVEPLTTVEAGNTLRQLEIEEEKEIDRILRMLSGYVAAEADALLATGETLARLDLAYGSGEFAHELRAVPPQFVDGPAFVEFPRARHPLLDPERVVPIDVHAGDPFRILVITGPNTGGKTVTLKTVGLLVLMAQSGLHVPSGDGARLSVFDGVFADIGDEQSIEQSLSTFSGHLTNIVQLLGEATERSLVLLDELGAGTDPVEGAALAGALLDHLLQRGITTIASTHYSELKTYAHATEGVANASVEFDVETLRPTYVLSIGLPGRSNALAIAQRLGLPDSILAAARSGLNVSDVEIEELLAEIHSARRQTASDRDAAAEFRQNAESWARRLESSLADLESERARVLAEARTEAAAELAAAREVVKALQRKAERLVDRQAARPPTTAGAVAEEFKALADEAAELSTMLEAEAVRASPLTRSLTALAVGDAVRVKSFGKLAEVLRSQGESVLVQMGSLRITVPRLDLERVDAPAPALVEAPSMAIHRPPSRTSGLEIDLRGQRAEEALDELEQRISDALLEGLPWVRIIHGHGTGALKQAVRERLRKHPSVRRMRAGERGEGGDGATVAYFDDDPDA